MKNTGQIIQLRPVTAGSCTKAYKCLDRVFLHCALIKIFNRKLVS